MKCIYCSFKNTDVVNSRKTAQETMVWRRRKCTSCLRVFTTREGTFLDNLFVIKKNKKRVRFVYEKLLISIFTALSFKKDKDNGVLALEAKKITYAIVDSLRFSKNMEVTSSAIAKEVYSLLKKKHPQGAELYKYYSQFRVISIERN